MDARYESVLVRFRSEIDAGQMVVHREFSNDSGLALTAEHLDWVYIDGDHTYEFVKRDLELFFGKLKPGGQRHDDPWASLLHLLPEVARDESVHLQQETIQRRAGRTR